MGEQQAVLVALGTFELLSGSIEKDINVQIPIYQIDAFASGPFKGNPAAVCPLENWLSDDVLQAIAMENNLSETAFFVAESDGYYLRWFTPAVEVDLCGHATLATGHVILNQLSPDLDRVAFETKSGTLVVRKLGDGLAMDFPSLPPGQSEHPAPALLSALGAVPSEFRAIREVHGASYAMAVFETEAQVAALSPQFASLGANIIATAPGDNIDFVSRFFAPMSGINEDPVTGSAHCTLAPYWAERLGKTELVARQISARGGDVGCRVDGDRVVLTGSCVAFMSGHINIPA